jgi:hypothetical protein
VSDPVVQLLEEQGRRGPADLPGRLRDRGEGYRCRRCELDVVVADQGEVVRHRDACLVQSSEHAKREDVVGAEDGDGPAVGEDPCGGVAS